MGSLGSASREDGHPGLARLGRILLARTSREADPRLPIRTRWVAPAGEASVSGAPTFRELPHMRGYEDREALTREPNRIRNGCAESDSAASGPTGVERLPTDSRLSADP
jgi:hypothetical protein